MSDEFVLYDIANRQNKCWNANVWKTRMLLNFTGMPYRTEWLDYPDIVPTLSALGVEPHPAGASFVSHTLPTVRFPDWLCAEGEPKYVMDSLEIARALARRTAAAAAAGEKRAAAVPALHLDDDGDDKGDGGSSSKDNEIGKSYVDRVGACVSALTPALKSGFMAAVPRDLLLPRGAQYWRDTRGRFLGMSVEELERTADRDAEWAAARPLVDRLAAMLREHGGGPYFLGAEPGYADILLAAWLCGASVYSKAAHRRVVDSDPIFAEFAAAAAPWSQRDD